MEYLEADVVQTWRLQINGCVQGVGFRPFVFRLATRMGIKGFVKNIGDGVLIIFNAIEERANEFSTLIRVEHPVNARIVNWKLTSAKSQSFDCFCIEMSDQALGSYPMVAPDFATCQDCIEDLFDPKNRRNHYAFTTCTNCGQRYSIISAVPYDRDHTEMGRFSMCQACQKEYSDPLNRRHHSQTNSCSNCGIELSLGSANSSSVDSNHIINSICDAWEKGQLAAVKGVGGYLLTCDAHNARAVEMLRTRKKRHSKPLAVMYPSVEAVKTAYNVSPKQIETLSSVTAPIILLNKTEVNQLPDAVAPGLFQVGVFLPYTPLHHLLLASYDKPIIATSANISNSPILFKDDIEDNGLLDLADIVVNHDLQILTPQDDSVLSITPHTETTIIHRRSRGFAPNVYFNDLDLDEDRILAVGADLKSTFSIQNDIGLYVSQYLGDLGSYDTLLNFKHALHHLVEVVGHKPETILCDLHPNYASTNYAKQLADDQGLNLVSIQHHKAHFAAILGEHQLHKISEPVLGIVWDGTGYGDDRQIWGGEFFTYLDGAFERMYHLGYVKSLAGDKMAKEPRLCALSFAQSITKANELIRPKFNATEWQIYQQQLRKQDGLFTSSVGRLFDAVASLLDLQDTQSYEGEAAMKLEQLAVSYFDKAGYRFKEGYGVEISKGTIQVQPLIEVIVEDILLEVDPSLIAAKFHLSLVEIIEFIATKMEIKHLACSGGVFQNGLLVDLLQIHLSATHNLYFHQQLSPNDENISFGQLMYYHLTNATFFNNKE